MSPRDYQLCIDVRNMTPGKYEFETSYTWDGSKILLDASFIGKCIVEVPPAPKETQKIPDAYVHGAWLILVFAFAYGLGELIGRGRR